MGKFIHTLTLVPMQKKMTTRLFFLTIFFIPFVSIAGTSDSTTAKNIILLRTAYPLPASGATFQRVYSSILNVNGSFERLVFKKIYAGVAVDYSRFQTDRQVLDVKTKMNIIAPSVSFGWQTMAFKKFFIHPLLNGGYAFISYGGTDADGNPKPKFTEQGAFIQSSLFLGYLLSNKISVGLNGSYEIIFQHFGNDATFEDSNIRIAGFGIGISCKL